jgi:hypothetical protein
MNVGRGGVTKPRPSADIKNVDGSEMNASASVEQPLGAIYDTNSKGRFDLVVYSDGVLCLRGTHFGVALRAAGIGMVGGGGGLSGGILAGGGGSAGFGAGRSYEERRLVTALASGREEAAKRRAGFFIARDTIIGLALRQRWYGHSLTIRTTDDDAGRRFDWKPRLNRFDDVEALLRSTFGNLCATQ